MDRFRPSIACRLDRKANFLQSIDERSKWKECLRLVLKRKSDCFQDTFSLLVVSEFIEDGAAWTFALAISEDDVLLIPTHSLPLRPSINVGVPSNAIPLDPNSVSSIPRSRWRISESENALGNPV